MTEQFIKATVRSCWDILIKIQFNLDLNLIGIPLEFSFSLPFLPGIPFYVPQLAAAGDLAGVVNTTGSFMVIATSSFLFYAYGLMSHGLVSYVTGITQALTNVMVSQNEPAKSVMDDMNAVASPVVGAAKTLYDKTIGGNYAANPEHKPQNYDGKLRRPRGNGGVNDDSKPTTNNDTK